MFDVEYEHDCDTEMNERELLRGARAEAKTAEALEAIERQELQPFIEHKERGLHLRQQQGAQIEHQRMLFQQQQQ
jgi:hypothetical protein